ncbi:MAG: adenylate/guanylate cyclase domain-containing protein [Spirochaetota bacterium]
MANRFKNNLFFLILLLASVAFYTLRVRHSVFFISWEGIIVNLIILMGILNLMRFLIAGKFSPLRFLRFDSEYGSYQHYKTLEDAVLPAGIFAFFSIIPLILVNMDISTIRWQAHSVALVTLLSINLVLNILYAYFLQTEANSVAPLNKQLIFSGQFANSLYLNSLNLVLFVFSLLVAIHFYDGQQYSKSLEALFTYQPDLLSGQILFVAVVTSLSLLLTLLGSYLWQGKNRFYLAATLLNTLLAIFSLIEVTAIFSHSDSVLSFRSNLSALWQSILCLLTLSGILYTVHYKIESREKVYIKPVHFQSNTTKEVLFGVLTILLTLFSLLITGMSLMQIISILVVVSGITLLVFRRKQVVADLIAAKTFELEAKNAENEKLLLNILPGSIAARLKNGEEKIADHFETVTVLFADIVGFTQLSQELSSIDLVNKLNELFSSFDQIAFRHKIEKIKTIGDCYMAVAGIPVQQADHAEKILHMAEDMIAAVQAFNKKNSLQLSIRIGINSGEVVAGVIGEHKFIYDLWGDSVNTASRMESHGEAGKIHVTEETYKLLQDRYNFTARGEIAVKGKGKMKTFFYLEKK